MVGPSFRWGAHGTPATRPSDLAHLGFQFQLPPEDTVRKVPRTVGLARLHHDIYRIVAITTWYMCGLLCCCRCAPASSAECLCVLGSDLCPFYSLLYRPFQLYLLGSVCGLWRVGLCRCVSELTG